MKKQCETAIKAAAGRELTTAEFNAIDERIRSALRELPRKDRAGFLAMSPEQRLKEAAKLAKEYMLKDVVRAHEQTVQDVVRKNKLFSDVRAQKAGVQGQMTYLKNRIVAVENRTRAIASEFVSMLTGFREADNGRFFGLIHNPEKQFEIVKALRGEASTPEAATFAKSLNNVMSALADRFQLAGLTLNKLDDYFTPQAQDPGKVSAAKRDTWIADHMTWIDKDVFFKADGSRMTDDEIKKVLEESFQSIATDGANKRAEDEDATIRGSMLVGASKNAPRRLFYKDAASWQAAMNKYGVSSNLYELVHSHIHSMSKDIALAEEFGRNAEANFKQALAIAKVNDLAAAKGKSFDKIEGQYGYVQHMYDAYVSPMRPGNARVARHMSNIRAFISSVMLGNGIVTSTIDLGTLKSYAERHKMPQARLFSQIVRNAIPDAERNDFLGRLGIWHEGFQSAHQRLMEENMSYSRGQFLSDLNHKLMMQNAADRGTRTGFAMTLMNMLGKFTRTHTLAAADGETKFLQGFGVTEDIYKVWQASDLVEGYGADSLLSPTAIHNIPDAKLEPIVEAKAMARSETLKAEINKRNEQTAKEKVWLENRFKKFNEARDKAYKWLVQFDERRQKMVGEAADMAAANAELMLARLERAEVEHDIAGYLKTETSQKRIKRFLERVEDGENVERQLVKQRDHPDRLPDAVVERYQKTASIGERATKAVEDYGRSINEAAESIGQRRARTEARIKAAERRLAEMSKKADAEVQRKADALDKRFAGVLKDIEEMSNEYKARAAKRAEYAAAFEAKVGKVLGEELMRAKYEAAEKLLEIVYGHAQKAVRGASGASIEDRVAFGLTRLPAGTFMGEALRFGLQFKSVPLGVFRTQMEIYRSLETGGAKAAYAAKTFAYLLALAAFQQQIKSLLVGQDPSDMDPSTEEGQKFWMKSLAASGGLGIYGDIIANSETVYGRGMPETLLGPGVSIAADVAAFPFSSRGLSGLVDQAVTGESENDRNYGLDALKFARRNAVPLANIWYLKNGFNRLVYDQLQEMIEPGTIDRHRQRMESRGASYWWEPGELTPERAPDLSKAYEE